MNERPTPGAQIAGELRALGLRAGDLVMVHASLRRLGPVEGRGDGVIGAILDAVAPGGTMLMVLGAADDHAWVNERPEGERAALLAEAQPFDAWRTPADPEVGTLAELFRQYPGSIVSDHPEGRFAAHGPLAHELLRDVPWNDYFGPASPLERLVEHDGRVLRLGADLNTLTALHHAEYRCSVWPKRRVRRHRRVASAGSPRIRVVDSLDDEHGIVDYAGDDYFSDLLRDYLSTGRGRRGTVGDAPSELLEADDVVDFGTRWMDQHLDGEHRDVTMDRIRARLDRDLLDARKRQRHPQAAAIASLRTALADAEAVPVEERPHQLLEGSAEVPRRELGAADIAAVVRAEIDERRRAIADYAAAGAPTGSPESELAALERYRRPA